MLRRAKALTAEDETMIQELFTLLAEWVMLNTGGAAVSLKDEGLVKSLVTNARRLYLDTREGQTSRVWTQDASFLTVNGREVFRQTERGDVTRDAK